ncbi:MAG TPA: DUF1572 family protein [Candidatus Sulfotelmatobacter sp.]|jgi:hypothetical protein|nr:DUF1572 family protein [Candidatus Sulfotelmatobacter sp.]
MPLERTDSYLKDSIAVFHYYKNLGERAMNQCNDAALFQVLDVESNSITVIVKHMAGNMRSRWTDFLTSDGEKPDRNRDAEFEARATSRVELMEQWNAGWNCLFAALEALSDADLTKTVLIRAEAHSVMQAINRQIAHYSYHVGQIVFLAKHFGCDSWKSLTVPRKQSAAFNADVASGKKSQR